MTGLDSIQRLWLRGNHITQITGLRDIGDTLISLNLRTNRLSSIDLSGLANLRQLYLSDNQLTAVDLSPVTELDVLWLDNGSTSVGSTPDPAYQNQITTLAQLPRFLTDLRLAAIPWPRRSRLRPERAWGSCMSATPRSRTCPRWPV